MTGDLKSCKPFTNVCRPQQASDQGSKHGFVDDLDPDSYVRTVVNNTDEADDPVDSDGEWKQMARWH